jgi:hypothetical protein
VLEPNRYGESVWYYMQARPLECRTTSEKDAERDGRVAESGGGLLRSKVSACRHRAHCGLKHWLTETRNCEGMQKVWSVRTLSSEGIRREE